MNTRFGKLERLLLALFMAYPLCISIADADVLVGSWPGDSIRRYSDDGEYLGDFVEPNSGGLDRPDGMDFGPDGNLYVSSSLSNQVLKFDGQDGEFIEVVADSGLFSPGNLQFGPDGMLYVCNTGAGQVLRFEPDGTPDGVFASGGGLTSPVGLLWKDNDLLVSDFGGFVRRYNAKTGAFVDNFASVPSPLILNQDSKGNVLVSSHASSNIFRFDCDGNPNPMTGVLVDGPVACPVGHLFNAKGQLLVASWQNSRLLLYDEGTGQLIEEFSSGFGLAQPNDLLLMPSIIAGDVNMDGAVDLLDVAPFVQLLTDGGFQDEADINGDGAVDLLDVAPFVELLAG